MEAGLSLRRSPLLLSNTFSAEQQTSDTATTRSSDDPALLEDLHSTDRHYQAAFTGDIDPQEQYVYRRPYVDRAFLHSKRRSQLIFEQKYNQHRSAAASSSFGASEEELTDFASISSPRSFRTRRPDTAPHRAFGSPRTPESAPGHLDFASRGVVTASGGLRELAIGASAQPASNRASWIRKTRDFEAHSDSHHTRSSSILDAAALSHRRRPLRAVTAVSSSVITGLDL